MFVLASSFATLFLLFHSGNRYATMAENQSLGVQVAERTMERLRGWSRKVHGPTGSEPFSDASWSHAPLPAVWTEDPETPGFFVQGVTEFKLIGSPCSNFNDNDLRPADKKRNLTQSVRRVEIHVSWGARGHQSRLATAVSGGVEHVLVSLIALPTGNPNAATGSVSLAGSSSLAHNASSTFTPNFSDSQGRPLPDLFFRALITPINGSAGFGTITRDDPNRKATLVHGIDVGGTATVYAPGQCRVDAVARYCGKLIVGSSQDIVLNGP